MDKSGDVDDASDTFEEDDSRSWKRPLSDKLNTTTTSPKAQAALADLGLFGFDGDDVEVNEMNGKGRGLTRIFSDIEEEVEFLQHNYMAEEKLWHKWCTS